MQGVLIAAPASSPSLERLPRLLAHGQASTVVDDLGVDAEVGGAPGGRRSSGRREGRWRDLRFRVHGLRGTGGSSRTRRLGSVGFLWTSGDFGRGTRPERDSNCGPFYRTDPLGKSWRRCWRAGAGTLDSARLALAGSSAFPFPAAPEPFDGPRPRSVLRERHAEEIFTGMLVFDSFSVYCDRYFVRPVCRFTRSGIPDAERHQVSWPWVRRGMCPMATAT
jgi:hypothetical protein